MKLALAGFWVWALIVTVHATAATVHGKVIDSNGRPVSGAQISLNPSGVAQALFSLSAVDGSYSLAPIRAGVDYELHADHDGLSSRVKVLRAANADAIVAIDLALAPAIRFEDITSAAGIDFILRNGAAGRFHQPEIMLGGVAAFDFNNDGCMDIFVSNGATLPGKVKTGDQYHNRLYRNNCDMTFSDVTEKAGLAGEGYAMGVATADFDNDGFEDLFVTGIGKNTLYRNRGDGTFEDITHKAGLDKIDPDYDRMWSISAGWFDYDNDGFLDLFVTNYVVWNPETEPSCKFKDTLFYCHPRDYQGLPNQLFHNNHDGTFTDVSTSSGIRRSIGKGMSVAFGDFNGDGLTDVFVANDSVPNFLFQNLGNGQFKEVALDVGVAYNAQGNAVAGMGADFRDFNDDGLDDIALDAMYWDGFTLYRNRGKPDFFADDTVASGMVRATRNLTGWGMGMYDFDNDGHKDLFYATSHFPGSEAQVQSPAAIPNHVIGNLGNGKFEDVSALAGKDFQQAELFHGAAFADFDNDGRVDVVVTAVNGPLKIFRNISPQAGHWLAVKLVGAQSNRDGLGARVSLTLPNGEKRYNHATTSVGYASSSEPLVRFGLGPHNSAQQIEIRWPSGHIQTLKSVKADQTIIVKEK